MTIHPLVAYVAGPYRDPRGPFYIRQNIREAEAVGLELWRMGIPALVPHKNTEFFDGAAPDEVWLAGDLEMLRRCDFVVCTERWEQSSGARAEVEFALSLGLRVYYWPRCRDVLACDVRHRTHNQATHPTGGGGR